jgi:hypothetical protein
LYSKLSQIWLNFPLLGDCHCRYIIKLHIMLTCCTSWIIRFKQFRHGHNSITSSVS